MCGIAGIYFKSADPQELEGAISRMSAAQKRRGPDDSGVFFDEKNGLAFGHTRLSILDLSAAGHQPMHYERQASGVRRQASITFNGEIYNFLELKKELESKGHRFKTKNDTEVILAAYAEWGTKSFEKLRGMFAFGLWDGERRKLFLVKDRYGIKPLYYYSDKKKIVFASTVGAIKESGTVEDIKNEKSLIGFLLFGSVPLPHTTIKNVFGLPAGHYLEADVSGEPRLVKYYEPLSAFLEKKPIPNSQFPASNTRHLLEESVRLHMISDAPLGVFLSGGIDSSALTLLASRQLNIARPDLQKLKTLSIIFDEPEYSEQKYQHLIARKIGSDHREYKVTKQDFENSLEEIWEAMDQPTVDGINTFFVAKAAKEAGLKAVLSGLGADEIFLGYNHFRRAALLKRIQSLPGLLKPLLSVLGLLGGRYSKLSYLNRNDVLRFYLAVRGLFAPHEVAKILNIAAREINDFIDDLTMPHAPDHKLYAHLHPADLLSHLELKFYIQNQLLKDSDFMAMHHSIEIRVPFLDHVLVEYLSSLQTEAKLSGKNPKQLLIDSVLDLPDTIYNRPKMGFTFPFQKWLFDPTSPVLSSKFAVSASRSHWSRAWAIEVIKIFS